MAHLNHLISIIIQVDFELLHPIDQLPWPSTSLIITSIASFRSAARIAVTQIGHPFLVRKLQTKRGQFEWDWVMVNVSSS